MAWVEYRTLRTLMMKNSTLVPESGQELMIDLHRRLRAPLMAYFLRRTRDRQDAEDLTQDAFARLVGSDSKFETDAQANAYVFRVAANLLADRGRRGSIRKCRPLVEFDESFVDPVCGYVEGRSPERVLIGQENLDRLYQALEALDDRTRTIFILYRIEGLKHKDIAVLLGLGLSTVEKHCMLAMSALTAHFPGTTP